MSDTNFQITPARPYILRAVFEWIEDNDFTPYLMVNATYQGVKVPMEYVQDGRIVLSIASQSTHNMHMGNDYINFDARFGGVSQTIWIPLPAVMGIYAKESADKMATFFDPSEYDDYVPETVEDMSEKVETTAKPERENKAGLKVLK